MGLRQRMQWAIPRGRRGSSASISPRDLPLVTAFSVCRRISEWACFDEETCRQSSRRLLSSRCNLPSQRSAKRMWIRCTPHWCRAMTRWRQWRRSSTFLPSIVTLPRSNCQRSNNPPFFVPSNNRNTSNSDSFFTFGSGCASTRPHHRPHGGPSAVESATSTARSLLGWLQISTVRTLAGVERSAPNGLEKVRVLFITPFLLFPTASSIGSLPCPSPGAPPLPLRQASCWRRSGCPASTACP